MEMHVNCNNDFEILYESIHGRTRGVGLRVMIPLDSRRLRSNSENYRLNLIQPIAVGSHEREVKITYATNRINQYSSYQSSSAVMTRSAIPSSSAVAARLAEQSSSAVAARSAEQSSAVARRSERPIYAVASRSTLQSSSAVIPGPTIPSVVVCPVCLQLAEEITNSNYELLTPDCGHIICSNCMIGILQHDCLCPKCRTKINQRSIRKIYL